MDYARNSDLAATMCRACVETDRDTRLIVIMPYGTSAAEFKERVCQAHRMSFPEHGDVAIKRMMIMVAGFWYAFSQGCVGTACQGTDARFKVEFFEEQEEVLDGSPQRTSESEQEAREAAARSSGDSRRRHLRLTQQAPQLRSSQDAYASLQSQRSLMIEERDVSGTRSQNAARGTGTSSPPNESAANTGGLAKHDDVDLVSKKVDMAEKSVSPPQSPLEKPGANAKKELENPRKDGNEKVVMEESQKELETGKDKIQVTVSEQVENAANKTPSGVPVPISRSGRNIHAEASKIYEPGSSKVNAEVKIDESRSGEDNVEASMEKVRGTQIINQVVETGRDESGIDESKTAKIGSGIRGSETMVGVQGIEDELKETKADSREQNQHQAEMEAETATVDAVQEVQQEEREMLPVEEAKSLSVPGVLNEESNKTVDGRDDKGAFETALENARSIDNSQTPEEELTSIDTPDGITADRVVTDEEKNVKEVDDKDSEIAVSVDAKKLEELCDKVITQHFSSDTSSSDGGDDNAAERNAFQPVKLSKAASEGKRTKMLAHKRVMADTSSESESDDSFVYPIKAGTPMKRMTKRLKSVSSSSESESEKLKEPETRGKEKQVAANSPQRKLKEKLEDLKAPEEKRKPANVNAVQAREKPLESKAKATIPDDGDSSEDPEDRDNSAESERERFPQSKATENPKELEDAEQSRNEKLLKAKVVETERPKESRAEASGKGKKQSEQVLKDDENSEESSRDQTLNACKELGAKVTDQVKQQELSGSQKVDKSSQEKDKKSDSARVSEPSSHSQPTIQTQADSESSASSGSDSDSESDSDFSGAWKQGASKVSASRRNTRRNDVDSRFQEFVENYDGLEKLLSIRRSKPPAVEPVEVVPETQNVVEEEEDPMAMRTCAGASTSAPANRKRPPAAKNVATATKKRAVKQDASLSMINRAEPSPSSSKQTPILSNPSSGKPAPSSARPVLASPSPSATNPRGLASPSSSVMSGKVTGKKAKGKKSATKGR